MALAFLTITAVEFWISFGINLVQDQPVLMLLVVLLTAPSIYGFAIGLASQSGGHTCWRC
jgi:hypothetical protein